MKAILIICSILLFIALANLPIGYYTILRITVTIGAVMVIIKEFKGEFSFWIISFGVVAILFNPLLPVYLNNKEIWMPIDLITGVLFAIKAFNLKNEEN